MTTTSSTSGQDRVVGTISVHPRGFGFLNLEDGRSAFVAPPALNGLLDGDRVSARLVESGRDRYEAHDPRLELRWRGSLFGTLALRHGRPHIHPDPTVSNTDWPLEGAGDLDEGAWLVAEIVGGGKGRHRARLEREVPAAEVGIERVIARHGLISGFEPWKKDRRDPDFTGRRDLSELPTLTIDAPSSRDLDDALSALPADSEGALRVLVSIADVDATVPEDSGLDRQARRRGTSVYLAGRVLPMLPPALSEDALSLLPGKRRATLTVELRIDPEGEVRAVDLYESVIVSDARLSYDAVATFMEGGERDAHGIPAALLPTLAWLRTAAARVSTVRRARGGVELLHEEAAVVIGEDDEPTELSARTITPAHTLIERLMVAANEAVARWMVDRGLPCVFRVHPAPTPERLAALGDALRHFGFEAGLGERLSPRGLAALEAQFSATPLAPAMNTVLGRALGPARYTASAGSHFGLGAPLYAHFTSPIRRYADLTVHRIIKRYLAGDRSQHPGDEALEALAAQIDRQMTGATRAERERLGMLAARHFANRIGETFEGHVVAIQRFGLIVQLHGIGVAGAVPEESLPDGPYELAPHGHSFVSDSGDYRFDVGQRLTVRLEDVDEALGRLTLDLVARP